MFWRLLSGCWFTHQFYNARIDGQLAEQCLLCGHYRVVLDGKVIIGPAHAQQPDAGARTMKAKRAKDNKITFPERMSQR